MAKFHIKNDGSPAKCSAKKGKCPFNAHFKTLEAAQRAADKQNEKETKVEKDNTTEKVSIKKEVLSKHNKAHHILETQHYEKRLRKANEEYWSRMETAETITYPALKKAAKKNKEKYPSLEKFKKDFRANDPTMKLLEEKKDLLQTTLIDLAYKREQSKQIEKDTEKYLVDCSYSNASPSSYFIYRREDLDEVNKIFKSRNLDLEINPNIDENKEYIEVRMSDHYPKDFLTRKDKEDDNVWGYVKQDVLIKHKEQSQKENSFNKAHEALKRIKKLK